MLVDLEELKTRIDESGYRANFVATRCGLSYSSFWNRISGRTPFKVNEIKALKTLLKLSATDVERIFFANSVEQTSTKGD